MRGIKLKSILSKKDEPRSRVSEEFDAEAMASRALNGDNEAFEAIVKKYERLVYNIAYQKTNNPDDAADVTQEIFVKVWRSLSTFRGESSFSTWICRIAVNACVDYIRKNHRNHSVSLTEFDDEGESDGAELDIPDADVSVNPEAAAEKNENIAAVRKAIANLTDEQRTVILLRDIEGCSYTEISEITGLELGTVKSRINRARQSIKDFLIKNGLV